MYDTIRDFHRQFSFRPEIENRGRLARRKKILAAGMGGSQLAATLLPLFSPKLDIIHHRDYGLPAANIRDRLVIASSYSGNTEETLSAFHEARRRKVSLLAIASGGKLLARARRFKVPCIELPNLHIDPRSALGVSTMAFLAAIGVRKELREASGLARTLMPRALEPRGQALARQLKGSVPVVYSSARNAPLAYIWKIKLNETGKIPAFMNVLPELNHNEMNGFDVTPHTKELCCPFHFVFLEDPADTPRIQKRMKVLASLYRRRGLPVTPVALHGEGMFKKAFSSVVLSDWTAYHAALMYHRNPDGIPMVEEFKRLIRSNRE